MAPEVKVTGSPRYLKAPPSPPAQPSPGEQGFWPPGSAASPCLDVSLFQGRGEQGLLPVKSGPGQFPIESASRGEHRSASSELGGRRDLPAPFLPARGAAGQPPRQRRPADAQTDRRRGGAAVSELERAPAGSRAGSRGRRGGSWAPRVVGRQCCPAREST